MAARSTGVFPREKFDLDAATEVTTTLVDAPMDLKSIKIIRVIFLGSVEGENSVVVNVGDLYYTFYDGIIDANGVGIGYLRGSLCYTNQIMYQNFGATVHGVYIDAVETVD